MTASEQQAEYAAAAARTLAHSVTDSVSPEQQAEYAAAHKPTIGKRLRAAIEADVLRRVADEAASRESLEAACLEGLVSTKHGYKYRPRRGAAHVADWLRAEADRIEEGAR